MSRKQLYQWARDRGWHIATWSVDGVTRYTFFEIHGDDDTEFGTPIYTAMGMRGAKDWVAKQEGTT